MREPEFLELDAVLFLHDQAIREYGGMQALRDEGLLLSALARPANKLAYMEPGKADLFLLAAAYAYGLASNRPFNDGNKRTAWSSCVLFLKVNGVGLLAPAAKSIEQMVLLATGQLGEAAFANWLRSSAVGSPGLP